MKKTIKSILMAAAFLSAILLSNINSYAEEGHEGHQHAQPNMTTIPYDENSPESKKALQIKPEDNVMGKAEAPVTIIEYASLSCPHCAQFSADIFPQIKEKYIDTGKAKFIYRHFPLNRPALEAAMISECVSDIGYYSAIKTLFKLQEFWAFNQPNNEKLREIGKEFGLEYSKTGDCLNDKAMQERIVANMKEAGEVLKVSGTPTFFINGKMQKSSSFAEISKTIEDALKQ
jgi:protein-disulfide isomerase